MSITFCIITLNKTRWLANVLASIRHYCPFEYQVSLLVIGEPDAELSRLLAATGNVRATVSPVNLGCGGGRKLLAKEVTSRFTMMLDDDMYLTDGAIRNALEVLLENDHIGAVGLPQINLQGRLVSAGGRNLIISQGVITKQIPKLDIQKKWIEVEDLDGGAMLMRSEMLRDFEWDDRYRAGFDDLDKSLQILSGGKWGQAIVPGSRLIHDRSWLGQNRGYAGVRLDGLAERRSYRLFRAKWGLRLDLRSHIFSELVFPLLTIIRWQWPRTALDRFTRQRQARGYIGGN